MGIEFCVCSAVNVRVARSHDGVELGLLVGCRPYLTSLLRMGFAGFVLGSVPPRHQIEIETFHDERKVMFDLVLFSVMA